MNRIIKSALVLTPAFLLALGTNVAIAKQDLQTNDYNASCKTKVDYKFRPNQKKRYLTKVCDNDVKANNSDRVTVIKNLNKNHRVSVVKDKSNSSDSYVNL